MDIQNMMTHTERELWAHVGIYFQINFSPKEHSKAGLEGKRKH